MAYLDWKVGDKVVCVNANGTPQLREGRVYTIAELGEGGASETLGSADFAVNICEERPNFGHIGFHPARFRKVQPRKTDIAIFTAMLDPSRQQVDA